MFKALLFIFMPVQTWERVFRAQRGLAFILTFYLLPLLGLTAFSEGYGLVHWGKGQGRIHEKLFTVPEAAIFEIAQGLLTLSVVLLGASVIKSISRTFHSRHTYTATFTVVAYGLSPMFLLRLLDAFPPVNPWVSWSIGILLSVTVLYQGVPRVMQPDPPQAFGLFFMSALLLTISTGLVRLVTACYLGGSFKSLEAFVSNLAGRIPF